MLNKAEYFKIGKFSKKDTLFFKGAGILLIIFHNYMHVLPGFGIENEWYFNSKNIHIFFNEMISGDLKVIFASFFSFFGHFGVQLFIFFSAYGLTIQFSKKKDSSSKFVLHRLKKIYFLLSYGILICVIFYSIIGISFGIKGTILRTLLSYSTIMGFTQKSMFIGPYWFFDLIIQFYILFPLLFSVVTKSNLKRGFISVMISIILVYILFYGLDGTTFTIKGELIRLTLFKNIFGHLPEFLLGIVMAHWGIKYFKGFLTFLFVLIFIGSQFWKFLYPLSFLSFILISLPVFDFIKQKSPVYFNKTILYVGSVSMILFLINGPLRSHSFFNEQNNFDQRFNRFGIFLLILFVSGHILYWIYLKISKLLKI